MFQALQSAEPTSAMTTSALSFNAVALAPNSPMSKRAASTDFGTPIRRRACVDRMPSTMPKSTDGWSTRPNCADLPDDNITLEEAIEIGAPTEKANVGTFSTLGTVESDPIDPIIPVIAVDATAASYETVLNFASSLSLPDQVRLTKTMSTTVLGVDPSVGSGFENALFAVPSLEYHMSPELLLARQENPKGFTLCRIDPSIVINIKGYMRLPLTENKVIYQTQSTNLSRPGFWYEITYMPLDHEHVPKIADYKEYVSQAAGLLRINFTASVSYFRQLLADENIDIIIALTSNVSASGYKMVTSVCLTASVSLGVSGTFATSVLYMATNFNERGKGYGREMVKQLKAIVDDAPGSSLSAQSIHSAVSFWKKDAYFTRYAINMAYALNKFDEELFPIHDNTIEFTYP